MKDLSAEEALILEGCGPVPSWVATVEQWDLVLFSLYPRLVTLTPYDNGARCFAQITARGQLALRVHYAAAKEPCADSVTCGKANLNEG